MASGAAGALAHAFRLVTEPGDEILTFAPFSRNIILMWISPEQY